MQYIASTEGIFCLFLDEGLNTFLNENWQIIFEELRPAFEQAFAQIFKEMTHRVFSKVPIDKVFNMP